MTLFMKKNLLFILGVTTFLLTTLTVVHTAQADRMESDSYVIQFGNFNTSSGEETGSTYNVTHTMGQIAPGPFDQHGSANYYVYSGFQYIYQIHYFGFSISDVDINLGLLTPGIHNTATTSLTVNTRGTGGYDVYAYELWPLRNEADSSKTIVDTSCDVSCTISSAGVWTDQDNAGFGFNMSGDNIASDFTDSTYFRPFADDSDGDSMQQIMTSNDVTKSDNATVTFKAGITGDEAGGNYHTGIVFIAVPEY